METIPTPRSMVRNSDSGGGGAEGVDFPERRLGEDEVIKHDRAAGLHPELQLDHVAAFLGDGFLGVEDFDGVFASLDVIGAGGGFG
jgi:hypothetical protein